METDPEWHNRKGVSLSNQGHYEEALTSFETAIRLNPEASLYYYNLAQMALALGQMERAKEAFEIYEERKKGRCPYFSDRKVDRHEHLPLIQRPSEEVFENLLTQGFRRKYEHLARNVCLTCQACVQNRILVKEFKATPSQKRVLRKNKDLVMETRPANQYDDRHKRLYELYVQTRHGWDVSDCQQQMTAIHESTDLSLMHCWYEAGELILVGVFDAAGKSLYASECYYSPQSKVRSLGVFNILGLLNYGLEQDFEHLYLGEYIEELPSMKYKMAFQPQEILVEGKWTRR